MQSKNADCPVDGCVRCLHGEDSATCQRLRPLRSDPNKRDVLQLSPNHPHPRKPVFHQPRRQKGWRPPQSSIRQLWPGHSGEKREQSIPTGEGETELPWSGPGLAVHTENAGDGSHRPSETKATRISAHEQRSTGNPKRKQQTIPFMAATGKTKTPRHARARRLRLNAGAPGPADALTHSVPRVKR